MRSGSVSVLLTCSGLRGGKDVYVAEVETLCRHRHLGQVAAVYNVCLFRSHRSISLSLQLNPYRSASRVLAQFPASNLLVSTTPLPQSLKTSLASPNNVGLTL